MPQLNRYARQMKLPEVGEEGQRRLSRSNVLVIGSGGLGCPVLQYLAGAGVGNIVIVDPDTVSETNLHRQPIYTMHDIGKYKAKTAAAYIRAINTDVHAQAHCTALDPDNAVDWVKTADIVIDAADSFAVSYTLSDICLSTNTPLISASVLGQRGYIGGFCHTAPSLRAVFPELPKTNATCASAGVLGPVVGVLGALQAQLAIQVMLHHNPSPMGRIHSIDLANFVFSSFSFQDASEPDHKFSFISKRGLLDNDQVFDLRDTHEMPVNVTPTTIRVTPETIQKINLTDHRVVLCCRTGMRAWQAANLLAHRHNQNIVLLADGHPKQ